MTHPDLRQWPVRAEVECAVCGMPICGGGGETNLDAIHKATRKHRKKCRARLVARAEADTPPT